MAASLAHGEVLALPLSPGVTVTPSTGTPVPKKHEIVLVGDIDARRQAELARHLQGFADSHARDVSVDLSHVSFLGSVGIAFLAALGKIAAARHGRVCLVQPSEYLTRLLKLVAMLAFFDLDPREPA